MEVEARLIRLTARPDTDRQIENPRYLRLPQLHRVCGAMMMERKVRRVQGAR